MATSSFFKKFEITTEESANILYEVLTGEKRAPRSNRNLEESSKRGIDAIEKKLKERKG